MATKIKTENIEFTIGSEEEFKNINPEEELLIDFLWYGITHLHTTKKGIKIFWIDKDIKSKRRVKSYLRHHRVDPGQVFEIIEG